MVYDAHTKKVFLTARYNQKVQTSLDDNKRELREFFADKTPARTAINTLYLDKVYILTTNGTASASKLVINGLAHYVVVVQIGEKTRGKDEFSSTLIDDREHDYGYNTQWVNKINPHNQCAIQPLIGRNENADGFSD